MIEPAFRTPLVATVRGPALSQPGFDAASQAAIALSTIAVRTDPEQSVASVTETNSRTENHFAMNRHAHSSAGL
jgi:hypothetical protein